MPKCSIGKKLVYQGVGDVSFSLKCGYIGVYLKAIIYIPHFMKEIAPNTEYIHDTIFILILLYITVYIIACVPIPIFAH